jgi:Asp-tRNA(Asn)/Glu-tRNA(Gln) amidotransferase A subunit family amidase
MSDLELCYTPALELARLIAAKTISPVEVVKNSLARIEPPKQPCWPAMSWGRSTACPSRSRT